MDENITLQNKNAQRIAMSDNKHDFSKVFDISVFQETSINCLREEHILNEDNLLKTLFNLERNAQNQFQYQGIADPPYQISYNPNFSTFIDSMANNPICIIDFDLGGFSVELIKYLIQKRDKTCTIYNGPEVKYDPAGKTNNISTFIRKTINRIGGYSNEQKNELLNQLQTQLKLDNLSRTALQIEPKVSCYTPFISNSQLFFTNRKTSIQEYEDQAYSLIEKKQKNEYFMFDKSFANATLNVLDTNSYKAFLDKVREASIRGRIQLLDFLRTQDIIKPSKGSSEHYLAKRLGDAGQALASRQIHNSILITHDRVLLAFALNIGVSRIVFTHPHQNTAGAADSGIYPISIFERNNVQTEIQQKENILRDISSSLKVISDETDGFNLEKVIQLIAEYNENSRTIYFSNEQKIRNINLLINSLERDFIEPSTYGDYNSFQDNINTKYQELINEIYQILPFLKINIKINITYELVENLNNSVKEFYKNERNLYTFPIESLKTIYNALLSLNSIIETKERMKILNESRSISIKPNKLKMIQLVKRRSGTRGISVGTSFHNIMNASEKSRIESRLESQFQLNILNDFLHSISEPIQDKVINFLNICSTSDFIEGGNYAKRKFIELININLQSRQRGGSMQEEQEESEDKTETIENELLIDRIYMIEEYIVSFIYSIFPILTFDDEKFNAFKRKNNELYKVINKLLYFIGGIYNLDLYKSDTYSKKYSKLIYLIYSIEIQNLHLKGILAPELKDKAEYKKEKLNKQFNKLKGMKQTKDNKFKDITDTGRFGQRPFSLQPVTVGAGKKSRKRKQKRNKSIKKQKIRKQNKKRTKQMKKRKTRKKN